MFKDFIKLEIDYTLNLIPRAPIKLPFETIPLISNALLFKQNTGRKVIFYLIIPHSSNTSEI